MHLGLMNGPFVPHIKIKGALKLTKAPDGPQAYALNILWFQKEGSQISAPKCGQGLTFTQNVGQDFLFKSTLPT
jgi:hypothetical protein